MQFLKIDTSDQCLPSGPVILLSNPAVAQFQVHGLC